MKNDLQKPLIPTGWLRALIYFIIIMFAEFGLHKGGLYLIDVFHWQATNDDDQLLQLAFRFSINCAAIVLITLLIRKFIDRKSFLSLGFSFKGYRNEAAIGFCASAALLGIGTLLLIATGAIFYTDFDFSLSLLSGVVLMIAVAISEEVIFRGYILSNLMLSANRWIALSISSAIFALVHIGNPGISALAIINIIIAGFLLGLNYIYTKNLWFSIFFHFSWNYFQGTILGYKVSGLPMSGGLHQMVTGSDVWTGGSFGFEGSLLCTLLMLVCFFIFMYFFSTRYRQK